MFTKFVRCAILGLVLMLLAACGGGQVTAGQAEQGKTVTLKAGETLLVTLDSNPTTGYSWQVTELDETVLKQKGEPEYKQSPGAQGLVGAGGTEIFRFEAVGKGTTMLTLVYARSWEKDVPPLETYQLKVIVE